ncbi:amidohydrolase family protein [Microbacterium sp. NPDC078428]|uniref:amidohydrolase family protein n=1 Tax=Microbacterium sp. NPDC078428 TaxID=3364190 RepID=UPI0037CB9582
MAQRADRLIQNAHVLTFDGEARVIADGAIAIKDGVIVDVGATSDVTSRWHSDKRTYASGDILMPGLVDAHLHTAQTLMRGVIPQLATRGALRVPTWREYLVPFEANLSPEDVELSGLLAYTAMLQTGTTTFFEAGGPHPESMASAAWATGIRGAVSQNTMDGGERIPSTMRMTTDEAIARNIELVEALPTAPDGSSRVTGCMSLRQIITSTPELVREIHREAKARGVKVHTHLVEGTYEIDFALERFGKRPIDHLIDEGVFDETLHGAHSILVDDDDVDAYVRHGVSAAHCAKGNYSIGTPPALRMWRRGVAIGLGTDGVATLGTLDLFQVGMLARVGQQHAEATPVHNRNGVRGEEILGMATVGGARAMALGDRAGSLAIGKRADIVVLRTDGPDAAAYASPEIFAYECATGRDVRHVLVDGEMVVKDGEVVTVDVAEIRARAAARQKELVALIA